MEHIVQFGINIDDDAIRDLVVRDAKKQIIAELTKDVQRELGITGNRYSRSDVADEIADEIMERCREDIVHETVERLAGTLPRRKWFRDAVSEEVSG